MPTRPAFTILELALVISFISLIIIAIILPALGGTRRPARQMQNSTQVRGIHTGLVLFAQGNNTYYPGLNSTGGIIRDLANSDSSLAVECRFQELLFDNYFTGEYAISPAETKTPWTTNDVSMLKNISYAMLEVSTGQRRAEWRETSNSEAPVLGDRAKRNGAGLKSIHTNPATNTTEWRGSVGFNDNHVSFESDNTIDTSYGSASSAPALPDDLFTSPTTDDALLLAAGTNLITVD